MGTIDSLSLDSPFPIFIGYWLLLIDMKVDLSPDKPSFFSASQRKGCPLDYDIPSAAIPHSRYFLLLLLAPTLCHQREKSSRLSK